jgi:hypothetical protein
MVWIILFLVIGIMVASRPLKRTVTPLYHEASANWWAGRELYDGPQGMNYMPHFAVLFSPFHALPVPLGDLLWRAAAMVLLAHGSWRILRRHFGDKAMSGFMGLSVLILPLCLGAIRNGQANAMFGGLTLSAIACLSDRQKWRAAALMALATMVKPLGIVLMLLTPALYPTMILPLAASLAGCLVFPFLFGAPDYVISQHQSFLKNISSCATLVENRFADINGIIRAFGGELPGKVSKLLRVGAGAGFLGLCYFGGHRAREPVRSLWLYALAAGYLMLFNPMNEHNSYVIFAPALGLWAVWLIQELDTRRLGWILVTIVLSMGLLPALLYPWLGNNFALVWFPLMTIVFLGVLTFHVFRTKTVNRATDEKHT